MTLNRMYHCVPRIISGLTHISTLRWNATMSETTTGKNRLAGNAARNCTTGWTRRASRGRKPIQTPTGTQTSAARAISTTTRSRVKKPSTTTCSTSWGSTSERTKSTMSVNAANVAKARTAFQPRSIQRRDGVDEGAQQIEQARALQHDEEPRRLDLVLADRLDLEALPPGEQRAEQQLVVDEDEDQHGEDGVADRDEIALLDRR